jgi:hypothetical protein
VLHHFHKSPELTKSQRFQNQVQTIGRAESECGLARQRKRGGTVTIILILLNLTYFKIRKFFYLWRHMFMLYNIFVRSLLGMEGVILNIARGVEILPYPNFANYIHLR